MRFPHSSLPPTNRRIGRVARAGFTLAELLVVLAITGILLTVGLQSFSSSSAQLNFLNSSNKVLDLIREARSLAISGKAQLDYTDFDKDHLNYLTPVAQGGPDMVTPAHYGVYLHHFNSTTPDEVVLFADNHGVAGGGIEGKYDLGSLAPDGQSDKDFESGYDIILEKFTLPKNIKLILPNSNIKNMFLTETSSTIFYSPIFADVSLDPIPLSPMFKFGFNQTGLPLVRQQCYTISVVAGIPESATCP